MERYFPKVAKASTNLKIQDKPNSRHHPYKPQTTKETLEQDAPFQRPKRSPTLKELNRGLLRTLANASNPITHSDAGDRADRIVSISTGHQVSEERFNRTSYLEERERRLQTQHNTSSNSNGVLQSVRIYISGYLSGTTDIEMRRIVTEAGGQTVQVASHCTHIVTSQWLSGSKTHRLLTAKLRHKPYIVRPEWVYESIAAGKRQPERSYTISTDHSHRSLIM